jgi:PIN domain nuclease of toxin-antitoxin system
MKVLLDTHAFLWWVTDAVELSNMGLNLRFNSQIDKN